MANIAATNITSTVLNRRRNNGRSYFNMQLAFGNGTLTYPAGGVPVTPATFGLTSAIESVHVYDCGKSGFVWQYDQTNSKLYCLESRDQDWSALTGLTSSWSTNCTFVSKVRVSGDTASFLVSIALAGAPTSAALTLTLPAAYTVDTAKMGTAVTDANSVGWGGFGHSTTKGELAVQWNLTAPQQFDVFYYSSITTGALTAVDATHPLTWANADELNIAFSVPVTGFAGGQTNGLFEPAGVAIAAQTLKAEVIGW